MAKRSLRCRLGWHTPSGVGFDGCSLTSHCKRCGRAILMDSQGNWFTISAEEDQTDA